MGEESIFSRARGSPRRSTKGYKVAIGNRAALVAAVVTGRSLQEIAALAGVSISTVQRQLKDPDVIAEVGEERSRQRQETYGRLTGLHAACLDNLGELINSHKQDVALRAIGMVLTTSAKLDLAVNLDERLTALEQPDDGDPEGLQETEVGGGGDVD
jgi:hypothetical protein